MRTVWSAEGTVATIKYVQKAAKDFRRPAKPTSTFDLKYGVDTAGVVKVSTMRVDSPNYVYAHYYKGTSAEVMDGYLSRLPIAFENFAFVDLGSGKGATLMQASAFPFRQIVGVEFAEDLHLVAMQNLARYRNDNQKCASIQALCMDAANYEWPSHPLVIYMWDPFEPPVLGPVLERLSRSLETDPREAYIIYRRPSFRSLLDRLSFLTIVEQSEDHVVYRTQFTP